MHLLSSWIILSIVAGLASNIFNFLSRLILKEGDDATAFAWFFESVRLVFFCFILPFDWKITLTTESITLFILLGLTETISAYWLMKMHENTHLSISTIISRSRLIWVAIIAFFLVHESLKISEYIGIVVLFAGLSIVVSPKKIFVDKGATYASLAAFMIALNIVIIKILLPFGSNSVVNATLSLFPAVLLPLFMQNPLQRIKGILRNNLLLKLTAVVANFISLYLVILALRVGEAGKVTAVYQGMLVVSVLAGIIFLKERTDIAKKLIGTAITLIGVFLLTTT